MGNEEGVGGGGHSADVKCEAELTCCVQNIVSSTMLAHIEEEEETGLQKLCKTRIETLLLR